MLLTLRVILSPIIAACVPTGPFCCHHCISHDFAELVKCPLETDKFMLLSSIVAVHGQLSAEALKQICAVCITLLISKIHSYICTVCTPGTNKLSIQPLISLYNYWAYLYQIQYSYSLPSIYTTSYMLWF